MYQSRYFFKETPWLPPESKQRIHTTAPEKPTTGPILPLKRPVKDFDSKFMSFLKCNFISDICVCFVLVNTNIRWLEWSDWSNCSKSCGTGVRVRTRLCSNTIRNSSREPCSFLRGSSFEIEACRNPACKRTN